MLRKGETMALRKQDVDDNDEQTAHTREQAQLTIGIDPALLRRIQEVAAEHNLSVDEYPGQILDLVVPKETTTTQRPRHTVPDDIMEQVYRVREQVIRDSKGQLFENSAEALRREREERSKYLDQLGEQ